MNDSSSPTDWRQLREFSAVDLTQSFVLSWHMESGALLIDADMFLTPEHPFYEKPRPAEKVCIRPAIVEFPFCDAITMQGGVEGKPADVVAELKAGSIEGLQRHERGEYELSGEFGVVFVTAERPILRLKGP